ncbi:hypothetical protein [Clostridium sp.]
MNILGGFFEKDLKAKKEIIGGDDKLYLRKEELDIVIEEETKLQVIHQL